jgi:hypothetical protein
MLLCRKFQLAKIEHFCGFLETIIASKHPTPRFESSRILHIDMSTVNSYRWDIRMYARASQCFQALNCHKQLVKQYKEKHLAAEVGYCLLYTNVSNRLVTSTRK